MPSLSNPRRMRTTLAAASVLASLSAVSPARAGEVYTGLGIPGIGLGYAQPVNDSFTLRGDVYSLGSRDKNTVESGINYRGDYKLHRAALLADWFPFAGSFRLTGGLAFNSYKITLDADGASGSLIIGDRTYATTAADGLNMQITFPKTAPYLGLGWGHQLGSGLRFSADIGAAIGRAKVAARARGPLAAQPDIQANIDKELVDVRDGVGRVRAMPQLSIGVGYSF